MKSVSRASSRSRQLAHGLALLGRTPSRIGWLILRLGSAGSGRALGPLSFWFLWQVITNRYYRLQPVQPGALLRYTIRRYHGLPLKLADGTVVMPGDQIAELHLDNSALAARLAVDGTGGRATAWTWLVLRQITDDLAALAAPGRLGAEVKALHGRSLLARAMRRLGFEVKELPKNRWNDLTRFFMLGLLTIYNPGGRQRLALAELDAYPAEIWLGRRALADRYQKPAT